MKKLVIITLEFFTSEGKIDTKTHLKIYLQIVDLTLLVLISNLVSRLLT